MPEYADKEILCGITNLISSPRVLADLKRYDLSACCRGAGLEPPKVRSGEGCHERSESL